MIRNIIFDLGQVLFEFTPKNYLCQNFSSEKADLFMKEIFKEKEWKDLDRGICSVEEAVAAIAERGRVSEDEAKLVLENRKTIVTPIDENIRLLEEIKGNGYRIYFLSNFHRDLFEDFYSEIPSLHLADGKVISSYVKLLKPEGEIFSHILKKYQLMPDETLFIDDTKHNIEAAREFGIRGIHLKSPKHLKKELEDLEIL